MESGKTEQMKILTFPRDWWLSNYESVSESGSKDSILACMVISAVSLVMSGAAIALSVVSMLI